jgi:hypothetical protein
MVILGLLLIGVGAVTILGAFFASSGTAGLLGMDLSALQIFLVGVVSGAFILWGLAILKYGTKRGLRHRRERRELSRLSEKLDKVDRRGDDEQAE